MWVYIYCKDAGIYTVGFYSPDGEWHPESDWLTASAAAAHVHYLNGSVAIIE